MDIEARQLALRNFEAVKRAETESARLFNEAKSASIRAPGTRAAVQAQQAYTNRLNAQVGRFRAAYALLAAEQGEKAESANTLARATKDASRQRTLQLTAAHAERRRNLMLTAADAVSKAMDNLPGVSVAQKPPSAQQTTVGGSTAFRSPEFLERFTHFFPGDIRAAAGSIQNNGFAGLDAVAECATCLQRDLATVTENCQRLSGAVMSGGDPAYSALLQRGSAMALSGLGSETVAVGVASPAPKPSLLMLAGLVGAGALAVHFYLKD